jgi:hypothetical protein
MKALLRLYDEGSMKALIYHVIALETAKWVSGEVQNVLPPLKRIVILVGSPASAVFLFTARLYQGSIKAISRLFQGSFKALSSAIKAQLRRY